MKSIITALSLSALVGASAFVPSGFMGSSVVSQTAVSDSKVEMILGGKKKGGAGVKAAKAGKPSAGPKFLKTPAPGVGPQGQWYVRPDPTLSTALPWVTKPAIGDGDLVGDFGFDPLGLSKLFDVNFLRAAELKHGRVSMLAALGLVTPELVQNPGSFSGFKFAPEFSELNAIKALSAVPKLGLAQIVLVIAFAEIATFKKTYNEKYNYEDNLTNLERKFIQEGRTKDLSFAAKSQAKSGINAFGNKVDVGFIEPEKAIPGDLGFDPLGFADNGVNPDYALAEIKHARLAMIGVAGMLLQEYLQDKGIVAQTAEWAAAQQ